MSEAIDLASRCLIERERLHGQVNERKCGSLGVNRKLKSGWIGVTPENIECVEHVIEALDHMLVCYRRGF